MPEQVCAKCAVSKSRHSGLGHAFTTRRTKYQIWVDEAGV